MPRFLRGIIHHWNDWHSVPRWPVITGRRTNNTYGDTDLPTGCEMMEEFCVRFWSVDLGEPQYVGRFWCADDAEDFCDEQNGRLALSGIPSGVANYFVTYP